jgi:hypothetical protein
MSKHRIGISALIVAIVAGLSLLGNAHAALAANVGYQDFSYGTAVTEPTGDKPQSKLWYNDGLWWGALWNSTARRYEIYRLDQATNTWSTTGVTIDSRGNTHPDMLWDGSRLYAVNAPTDIGGTDQRALLRRYSYDKTTKTYTRDAGFPVQVANNPMETIVLDKDTTGKLWVTYTQGNQVYVNRSLTSDTSWGTPFVLPVNGATVSPDDISSVIPFDTRTAAPKMGVMWSNQADNAVYFSTHTDGDADNVWSPSRMALGGPGYADDHINLKSLESDASGKVFAAVKTSRNDGTVLNPDDPLIELLVLGQDGVWRNHVFSQVRENQTKPMVMVDQANRNLYVFATGSGGVIYYKKSPLDNISFPSGQGTPFIKSDTTGINNVTSTKQNITTANGLASAGWLALANDSNRTYWHNSLILDTTPPETTIDSGPSGTVNNASATFAFSSSETGSTFQCSLDGAAPGSCTSPKGYAGLSDGSHTFQVKATDAAGNTDATPASQTWGVDTTAPVVDGVTPADGATSVAVTDNVEVTFSEAMDANTLNPDTFTLVEQGSATPVASAVSYDAQAKKAILNPDADLQADATYTATVATGAKDAAGNALGADKVWSFTAAAPPPSDTTAPETTVDSGPSGTVSSTSASFSFSSTETGSNFECKLDTGSFEACTSPTSLTNLSDGSHTFQVRATDVAGNTDATPASQTWTVDTIAPGAPAISSPADNSSNNDGNVTVSGTAEANSTVELFDGTTSKGTTQADASGGWSKALSGVADGSHTYTAKATDAAGNTSAASNSRTVLVQTADTTAPETTAPVRGLVTNSTISKQGASAVLVELTWSGTDNDAVASYELQRSTNGGAYVGVKLPSATATSFTDRLEPGNSYQFRVRAKDRSGNWSAWQQGSNFDVSAYQESDSAIAYPTGVWNTQTFSSAYGGSLKYTSGTGGQQAKFTFSGSEVAWVSFMGSDRGMADVYLDGAKVDTVDLYSTSGDPRKVVFARKGLDPTVAHTLEVRATGTKNAASSAKRVDVDAFVVLR